MKEIQITEADEGIRLDRWFKRHCPAVPHGMLEKALRKGMARLDGKKAESSTRVSAWQVVRFPEEWVTMEPSQPPKSKRWQPSDSDVQELRKMVIHRDDQILILNKPSGLSVQGGSGQGKNLDDMLDSLCLDMPHRPKLVHRLDMDTSGVLVLARTAKVAAELSKRFASKDIQKTYLALVNGMPMPMAGTIDMPLAKVTRGKDSRMDAYEEMDVVSEEEAGKRAITDYRVAEHLSNRLSWVELSPITGRTHQLRVHMASIGHPIVGDGKYGGRDAFVTGINLSKRLHLHALRIRIPSFYGKDVDISAPLPPHMQESARELQFDYKHFKPRL